MTNEEKKALDSIQNLLASEAKESTVYKKAEQVIEKHPILSTTVDYLIRGELGGSIDIGKDKKLGFSVNPEKERASIGFKMKFSEAGIVDFKNIALLSKDKVDNVNLLEFLDYQIKNTTGETRSNLRMMKEKLFGVSELKEKGILSTAFPDKDITIFTLGDLNNRENIGKIVDTAKTHQEYKRRTGAPGARGKNLVTWARDAKGIYHAGAMKNFFATLQSQVLAKTYGTANEASVLKTINKGKWFASNVLEGATFVSKPDLTNKAIIHQALTNVAAAPDMVKLPNGNITLNRDKIFTQLRLTTGIRVQDLMRLHKDDIKNGFVTITSLKSRSNTYETINRPISESTEKLLLKLANNPAGERGFLFVNNFEKTVQGEVKIANAASNYSAAGNNVMNATDNIDKGIRIKDKGVERRLYNKDFRKYIATLAKKRLKADSELRKAIMGQVGEVGERGMAVIDKYYLLDELPKGVKITPEWRAAMEQLDNFVFSEVDMNDADRKIFFSNVEDMETKTVIEGEKPIKDKKVKKQIKKLKQEQKPNILTEENINANKEKANALASKSNATTGTVKKSTVKVSANKNSINKRFGNKNKIRAGVALATVAGTTTLKAAGLLTPTPLDVPIALGMIAYKDIKDPHEFAELYPEEHLSWSKGKELDKLDSDIIRAQFTGPRRRLINQKQVDKLKNKRRILEDDLKLRGYDKDTALALGKNIREDIFEERKIQKFDIADPTVDPMISGYLQEVKRYEEKLESQMSSLMNE